MAPFESLGMLSYFHFAAAMVVCDIFSVKEWRDLEDWVRIVQGH